MHQPLNLTDTQKMIDILEYKLEPGLADSDEPLKTATVVIEEWYKE